MEHSGLHYKLLACRDTRQGSREFQGCGLIAQLQLTCATTTTTSQPILFLFFPHCLLSSQEWLCSQTTLPLLQLPVPHPPALGKLPTASWRRLKTNGPWAPSPPVSLPTNPHVSLYSVRVLSFSQKNPSPPFLTAEALFSSPLSPVFSSSVSFPSGSFSITYTQGFALWNHLLLTLTPLVCLLCLLLPHQTLNHWFIPVASNLYTSFLPLQYFLPPSSEMNFCLHPSLGWIVISASRVLSQGLRVTLSAASASSRRSTPWLAAAAASFTDPASSLCKAQAPRALRSHALVPVRPSLCVQLQCPLVCQ